MIPITYSTVSSGPSGPGIDISTSISTSTSVYVASGPSGTAIVSGPSGTAIGAETVSAPSKIEISPTELEPSVVLVNYITIGDYIPDVPYSFDDGVLLKTEQDLKAMDVQSLMTYASTVSTSIAYETSTLIANQKVEATYSLLKELSQSTMDGLDSEMAVNRSLILGYIQMNQYVQFVSTSYISTIEKYDNDILAQLEEIRIYNASLSSYLLDYDETVSSMEIEEREFITAATRYSSMYYIYEGFQKQYDSNVSMLDSVNIRLSTATMRQQMSYKALQESTTRWLTASGTLSSLYDERTNLGSALTRYRIDESVLYMHYISSSAALSTISSVYNAAVANETYALALSTATKKVTEYSAALETFQSAELLYKNSIEQNVGGTPATALGTSPLWAAKTMAYQRLQKIEQEKIAAQNAADNLQNLAGLANTSAYEALLLSYDDSIIGYATVEQTFRNYKRASLEAHHSFSSIFEQSVADIKKFSEEISMYNDFYDSSIVGLSSLLISSEVELSSIIGENLIYLAISDSISSLNKQYNTYLNIYNSNIEQSTMYAEQYYSSMNNVSMYTRYYDSTQTAIQRITTELYGSGGLLTVYNNTLFTNSSILNKELFNRKDYETQIKFYTNIQDMSMYEYRETYCRTKRQAYQVTYETNVFMAVDYAQTLTEREESNAAPGTTVTPIAADLTTPVISNSYATLNSMNKFLLSFSDLYDTYNIQDSNISRLSTSIGYEGSALSTVDFYTTAKYFNTPVISNIQYYVNNSCKIFDSSQLSTSRLLNTFDLTQSTINGKKLAILSGLRNFFTQPEIETQTLSISSFIVQSITDATTILRTQGVTII